MRDLILIAVSVAFFLLSIGYVKFCDRVKWGETDDRPIHRYACYHHSHHGVSVLRPAPSGKVL